MIFQTNHSTQIGTARPSIWLILRSLCARASSSATPFSDVARWSCKCTAHRTCSCEGQALTLLCSDVLHPNRANVSKDELRGKLGELYKAKKDDVSVFGFKTHFGGGKSTGFALIYDSAEAMKKFEPRYRLVRYGMATKVEKASRQQRTLHSITHTLSWIWHRFWAVR